MEEISIPILSMYARLRPLIFRLDPERAHSLTVALLRLAGALPPAAVLLRSFFRAPDRPVRAFGLEFTNPLGLAAGYDKDGLAWRGLACLGFGHIEIGTVTPRPQPGNPKPRVFRLVEDQAVINRMGFPGLGADFVARQLGERRPAGLVLGVNIGKNKDTPLEAAAQDYVDLLRRFAPQADYLAVNVSSPNTAGLRRLQGRAMLEELLAALSRARSAHLDHARTPGSLPILVKLAPDLTDEELEDALAAIHGAGMDGVIATNTTLARPDLRSSLAAENGGLSGAPLAARSRDFVRRVVQLGAGQLPVIGVGGVMNATDACAMLDAGACLVQVYTGLIYAGPGLPQAILREWANTA
jgi:dihydroorotate dehydrogenase